MKPTKPSKNPTPSCCAESPQRRSGRSFVEPKQPLALDGPPFSENDVEFYLDVLQGMEDEGRLEWISRIPTPAYPSEVQWKCKPKHGLSDMERQALTFSMYYLSAGIDPRTLRTSFEPDPSVDSE